MFKYLLLLLLTILLTTPAAAVIDEDENVIGLYFDTDADSDCLESVVTHSQIPCYIILTNPTFSDLYGFELGFDYGDQLLHLGTILASSEAIDIGSDDNMIVGYGSPTSTETATLLATLNMMYIDSANSPAKLSLRGSNPSSLDPAFPTVLLADSEMVSMALHSSPFPNQMNGICTYVDEAAAWAGVKSIYR